jgi:hypothetical protein
MAHAATHNSDLESCGLTFSELQELWLGPCNGSVFDTPEQLRDAWVRGRDVVMRLWGSHGRRPQAWWFLGDAASLGLVWPGYFREQSYLFEHNAFSDAEREQLLAGWRREFEEAYSLDGVAARRAHLDWADVPHSLRQRWQGARRRRERRSAAPSAGSPR